jgi:hypothetical protein
MKTSALMLLIATLLSGCIVMQPGHLYPIQGPLASQNPPPVLPMTLNGVFNSGSLTATLQGGEVCKGSWALIHQDDPSANKMAAQWDAVYGQGFFVANVLGGLTFARATLTGTQGTTVNAEFYDTKPGTLIAAVGIAQDSKGNLYKLTL